MRAACVALLAFACGAPPQTTPAEIEDEPPTDHTPSALLGTGLEQFVALTEGDELLVEQGYQGGYHLTVNVRAEGFSSDRLTVVFEGRLVAAEDGEACHGSYPGVALRSAGDGSWSFAAGARCFVNDPAAVSMQRVKLSVELESDRGEHASDAREIRAGRILRPY